MPQPKKFPVPPAASPWLRVTRFAALACLLLVIGLVVGIRLDLGSPDMRTFFFETLVFLAITSPFWVPPSWVFLRARRKPRSSLAFAFGFSGVALMVVVPSTLFLQLLDGPDKASLVLVSYSLALAVLAGSAFKASRALPLKTPPPRLWPSLARGGAFPVIFILTIVVLSQVLKARGPGPDHGWNPARELGVINVSAITYWSTYGGYPPSLVVMGPPLAGAEYGCHATGYLGPEVESGRKHGYIFVYTPGPPLDNPVPGCPPLAKSYSVTATPVGFGYGDPSYFTDDTGVIRRTLAPRPATAQDCRISYRCEDCKPIPE